MFGKCPMASGSMWTAARMLLLGVSCAWSVGCVAPEQSDDTGGWVVPDNTWPTASPPADLEGEGFEEGQVAPDFRMVDQHGDEVALWQFYGLVVAVDVSTMWCGPCQELAAEVEETYQDYAEQGFVYLTLLPENVGGDIPDAEDLTGWTESYGITAPVLSDAEGYSYEVVPDTAYPVVMILDRELRVAVERIQPAENETIRAAIEAEI